MERISRLEGSAEVDQDQKSVLHRLIDRCGPDSQIPKVMAVDALLGGFETTGRT